MRVSAVLGIFVVLPFLFASAGDLYNTPAPVQLYSEGEAWAQKTLKKLTLEQKIGQMLVIRARAEFFNAESPEYRRIRDIIRKYHVGGIGLTVPGDPGFLQRVMPYEVAMLTNQLQRESELPLLFAADFEYGLTMRVAGATPFPYPMAFGAARNLAAAEAFGRVVAEEARALGVHWNWFPTADVNSNPLNPIINTRSFGEDTRAVGALMAAYIRGAHRGGMLTTAKHFPGHGDTVTDSHLGLAIVGGDRARIDSVELPPFRAAIDAGVDAVMVAHVAVPALDASPARVASTSPAVVTGLLKKEMGFQGLVVTDSLEMTGVTRLYSSAAANASAAAALAVLKAGNDVILAPPQLDSAYRGLLEAVRRGEVAESRIDASVLKILRAKAAVGLHRARLVDLERVREVVARPASVALGEQAAAEAVTLVRHNGTLPLQRSNAAGSLLAVIFSDDVRSEAGQAFIRELRFRIPEAAIFYVDPQIAGALTEPILSAAAQAQVVVLPVYLAPVSGKTARVGAELKNTVSLTGDSAILMHLLLQSAGERAVVVALGNPYLAAEFPQVQTYLCTFSSLPVSETAAVRALFGEAPIRGRLPVSIPEVAQRGAGMDFPPRAPANSGGRPAGANSAIPARQPDKSAQPAAP